MNFGSFLIAWLVSASICGPLGVFAAALNRRSLVEGLALGVLLGPLGAHVAAILPAARARPRSPRSLALMRGESAAAHKGAPHIRAGRAR